jgi:hypothetical protein
MIYKFYLNWKSINLKEEGCSVLSHYADGITNIKE